MFMHSYDFNVLEFANFWYILGWSECTVIAVRVNSIHFFSTIVNSKCPPHIVGNRSNVRMKSRCYSEEFLGRLTSYYLSALTYCESEVCATLSQFIWFSL